MSDRAADVDVRRYGTADEAAVMSLLQASLGWVPDEHHEQFFWWKHRENAFGESPAWVALDGDRVVGFRTFMRWEFQRGDEVVRAVRAVDTATHPEYQGRGIFSVLTLHALDELASEGVEFVFNTPNEKSRPGYLKMGWHLVGRLPVEARPASISGVVRMATARVPAEKWSQTTHVGTTALEALEDGSAVESLLAARRPDGLTTARSLAYLRWRYGFGPLQYRAVTAGSAADGLAIFRLRRRGGAVEATICELLAPERSRVAERQLVRRIVRSGADYAVQLGGPGAARGFLPIPRQGPTLTWRGLRSNVPPAPDVWNLALGDVELF